jgi:hypothetical protein
VIESNVVKPGSCWTLKTSPRDEGGTVVTTTVLRNYR